MASKAGATILVVEDDDDIGMLLEFLLSGAGFEVERIADGQRASDFIASAGPCQIVLLDVMLPHVDGIELLTRIRANPRWAGVPVIMLTSKSTTADLERAKLAGASDYITKPFLPQQVLTRIHAALAPAG